MHARRGWDDVDEGARLGRQTAEVGVLHKAAGLRAQVVLGEVRQGAPLEAEGYSLAFHILLPHAGNHLRVTKHLTLALHMLCMNQALRMADAMRAFCWQRTADISGAGIRSAKTYLRASLRRWKDGTPGRC